MFWFMTDNIKGGKETVARKKHYKLYSIAIVLFLVLGLLGAGLVYPPGIEAATPEEVDEALSTGFAWLVAQQNLATGSWPEGRAPGTTALAVTALASYAKQLGLTPLETDFLYRNNVQLGLNYIFSLAQRDPVNQWVHWGTDQIYVLGPALMAISSTEDPSKVVEVPGSAVNGLTYLQVAEEVVNYVDEAQVKSGNGRGMWYYSAPTTTGDMSISGWTTLGLGYAKEKFGITLPQDMMNHLNAGIDIVQWTEDPNDPRYGGAGYTSGGTVPYSNWINIHKVGHLLSMMELVGDTAASPRVQRSIGFLERHWNTPNSGLYGYENSLVNGYRDVGWRGGAGDPPNPMPSYIATVSVMKGLLALGIDTITVSESTINWQDEFNDVVVANQFAAGYWEQGGYPPGTYGDNYRNYSTAWALMTMLRAVPTIAVTGVTLDCAELSLLAGGAPVTLTASLQPADATNPNVAWSSSNEAVATVVDGVVTPLSPGTAVISVTTEDGGFVAECRVTVTMPEGWAVTKTANPLTLTLARGASATIEYTIVTMNVDSEDGTMLLDDYLELNGVKAMWSEAVDGVLSIGGFEFTRSPEYSGPLTAADNMVGGTYTYTVTVMNVNADHDETFGLVNEASLTAGQALMDAVTTTTVITTPGELPRTGGYPYFSMGLLALAGGILVLKRKK
jgi:hypothetical protein